MRDWIRRNPMSDRVALGLVLVWPVFLALGVALLVADQPWAWFFVAYCATSANGTYGLARELWLHGIHNDR